MNQFEVDSPYKEELDYENSLKVREPEKPLIRIIENRESGYFDAVFGLDLAGITRREGIRESYNPDEKQGVDAHLNCSSLLAGMSDGQKLDFIYTGGKNQRGREFFNWEIVGYSIGISTEEAARKAKQLCQSISVFLGNGGNNYCFDHVNDTEKFGAVKNERQWMAEIQPSGIAIGGVRQKKIGFAVRNEPDNSQGAVIVPYFTDKTRGSFDSLVAGAMRCAQSIKLVLSVTPFALSTDDLRIIGDSLEWLQNGETKRIRYHLESNGIEELGILNGLKRNLVLWLKNPAGLRITCTAISDKPIPLTYLSMVGNEVFQGCPVSIKTNQETFCECLVEKVISLCGCTNRESALPPLFPGIKTLIDYGIKRVYRNPALNLPETGILMGRTGDEKDVRFGRLDRSRHCYIIGATGTGKSTLLYNMIIQDIKNGEGVAVIDPHGDLYQQVLESIPKHRVDDVVLVDPSDFEHSVGINFLEYDAINKPVQINFITNEMIKIFHKLYDLDRTGGPVFEQYMRSALLLVMDSEYHGATLMDIPLIFEDKDFRNFLLEKCKNSIVENFWRKQAQEINGDHALKNMGPYITSKLNQFTTNALLRPIIGQSKSTINFREIMDSGKILLVNLSKGLLGELDTQLLGMLIIGKIFTAAMSRVKSRMEHRRPTFLYVDEFQNFTTDTVAYLLSEARKFGLYLTLANQNLAQLSANSGKQNILDAVLGNVGTMLLFRLGAMDAGRMDIYTRPDLQAQDLQELPDFHAAGRLLVNNSPSKPFVFKTQPGIEITDEIDVSSIISASMRKYAMPTKQVEEEIAARASMYKYSVKT
jgi:hypothetical protein